MLDPLGYSSFQINMNCECTSWKKYTSGVLLLGLFSAETQGSCFPVPTELCQVCETHETLGHSWGNAPTQMAEKQF